MQASFQHYCQKSEGSQAEMCFGSGPTDKYPTSSVLELKGYILTKIKKLGIIRCGQTSSMSP